MLDEEQEGPSRSRPVGRQNVSGPMDQVTEGLGDPLLPLDFFSEEAASQISGAIA